MGPPGGLLTLYLNHNVNLTDRVRDANGSAPLAFQPALLDPLGPSVKIGLRKLF